MKTLIISYSFTGNNLALASSLATKLRASHINVTDVNPRSITTICLDILFNRTPKVTPVFVEVEEYDLVIFMGPVWMGHVATPLRAYFQQLRSIIGPYAFISISGGADGGNPKLESELTKRVGKKPMTLIDMHIADLVQSTKKPDRKMTAAYKLQEKDVEKLTDTIMEKLLSLNLITDERNAKRIEGPAI